ncbi:MAG: CDP-alcohol phosphatidyltransferase family protein [Chloroflexi bacterium]|nr:CDP-alcohol phosphatidyltransferase family protein [Chloroflexota bacterium]
MFTDWLRKVFGGTAERVARFLGSLGLSPNALTIVGCVLTVGVAVIIGSGRFVLGGLLLIITEVFDFLDGTLARVQGKKTKYGSFLDSTLDRVSDSAVVIALAWYYTQQGNDVAVLLAIVAVFGAMLVSYTRARAEIIHVDCKVGFFTRVERSAILVAALVLNLVVPALWILAIGTVATALHRMVHVYLQVRDQPL